MSKDENGKMTNGSGQRTVMIALICLLIGFMGGVGFTTYKLARPEKAPTSGGQSHDLADKAKALEAEVARDPANIGAWVQLGHIYFDSDQYEKAIHAYEKSLLLDPENADVLTDLGVMYRRSGQPMKAIESFEKAIQVDPKHESARFNKGIVLMNDLKEKEKALKVWEALLEINPIVMVGKDQSLDQLIKHYKGH